MGVVNFAFIFCCHYLGQTGLDQFEQVWASLNQLKIMLLILLPSFSTPPPKYLILLLRVRGNNWFYIDLKLESLVLDTSTVADRVQIWPIFFFHSQNILVQAQFFFLDLALPTFFFEMGITCLYFFLSYNMTKFIVILPVYRPKQASLRWLFFSFFSLL